MQELSKLSNAYVRGSPSRGTLGGVTKSTSDCITLCEAAGYNIILIETVGVGQSETAVEGMSDMFVLLASPSGGDELQGIKKGIMELIDLVVINKADGDLLPVAKRSAAECKSALNLIQPKTEIWKPKVVICSSLMKENIELVWSIMEEYWKKFEQSGEMETKRAFQRKSWMWRILQDDLMQRFSNDEKIKKLLPEIEEKVQNGDISPGLGVQQLINTFISIS
jgi:LAO/AO transport system kinase